jgi:DNA-binding transcriptional LysR family regulator
LQNCNGGGMEWDDLRLVLAIARERGLAGAARVLRVNHSTVFRRLNAAEADLGVQLFERLPTGYRPTEAGSRLIGAAERIEAETLAVERELTGRDTRLSGRVRVTCSETLAYRLLTAELARFAELHPGIAVELVIDNRQLDLSRREADVALRATRPVQRELFGRKLATMAWAVYGSLDHLDRHGVPGNVAALARHRIVGWGETALPVRAAEWLAETVPVGAVVYRTSSLINQLMAVRAGIGLAALPCYLADPEPGLRRALGPLPDLARELWLITHEDLKATARIRAFMEVVGEGLRARRELLEGG